MYRLFEKIGESQAKQLSPVTLAFVGDAVYSLYVRGRVISLSDKRPSELQKITGEIVSAKGQSALLENAEKLFTPEEEAIYRRGRNAKKATKSKHASVSEYNRSTGFEAVLGYLYLTGQYDRISQIIEGGRGEQ